MSRKKKKRLEFRQSCISRLASIHKWNNHGICVKYQKIVGDKGKTVEIDESKFGKGKYHRGLHIEGQWVFGGVKRGSGRLLLIAMPDRTKDTRMKDIKKWTEARTTIYSDGWSSYKDIGK